LVKADSLKIRQVIQNLIDNSIKYSETGGATIRIMQQGNEILFSITDTGIGLPPGQHLFEKFERGRKATNQHTEGVGLGLYLADKMIKAHSGKIWAESEGEGKGSKFSFTLPIIQ
jgi:histidine kinase